MEGTVDGERCSRRLRNLMTRWSHLPQDFGVDKVSSQTLYSMITTIEGHINYTPQGHKKPLHGCVYASGS